MNAAIKVFAAKGYHSCRTLDISIEAGVAYGSLYQYFKSKDDILLSIFRDNWNALLQRLKRFNETEDSPLAKITGIFDFVIKNYKHNPDLMKVMIMDIPKLNKFYNAENQALYNKFFSDLAEIIVQGQARGFFRKEIVPIIAAFLLYGSVDSTIRQYVYNPEFDRASFPIREAEKQINEFLTPGYLAGDAIKQ